MSNTGAAGTSSSLPRDHAHTVQFYGDDGVLLHELEKYIGSALASGSSAIVIASIGHIENLSLKLSKQGIDLDTATAENRYIALDAAEVLSKFMVNGRPNALRFSEVLGEVIARASEACRDQNHRVVAFGEMVALLWAEGNSEAAIELEKLWNNLARTYSFALHCAYPMEGFSRQEMGGSQPLGAYSPRRSAIQVNPNREQLSPEKPYRSRIFRTAR